jgi:hypothetical protein
MGFGAWIAAANDRAPGPGQLAPSYLYAHVFGYSASGPAGSWD